MAEEAAQTAAFQAYMDALNSQDDNATSAENAAHQFAAIAQSYDSELLHNAAGGMLLADDAIASYLPDTLTTDVNNNSQQQHFQQQQLLDAEQQHIQLLEQQSQQYVQRHLFTSSPQQQDDILQELMSGMQQQPHDEATAQQLMEVLEQQRRQNAAIAAAEEVRQSKPEKHYFTISQDGALRACLLPSSKCFTNT
jgi:hypothetical protein